MLGSVLRLSFAIITPAETVSLQLSFNVAVPAEPADLQLSFNVAVAGQVCTSACICSFLRNPFAFANVPPLPTGFCFRRHLQVFVSAATYRLLFPPPPAGFCFRRYLQVSVSAVSGRFALPLLLAAATARRRARTASFLKNIQI
ncbi:hypothetical protein [Methanimicrococcus hongohii]|uniref:hypothetical protein n=1 Tax=Methanimicrococcus hongohii TaxID=3028295 RepID=UPI002930C6B9|nr:hypothetical protein [Methanimicrococcus sp. Hf6]